MSANVTQLSSQRAGICQVVEWSEKWVLAPLVWKVPT